MTKEEAIKGLKENLCSLYAYGSQNMDSCDIRECDNRDYIKALEQNEVLQKENEDFRNYIDKANHTNSQLIQLIEKHKMNRDTCDDCVSRQTVIEIIKKSDACLYEKSDNNVLIEEIKTVPPETPTHGTCKDCTNYVMGALDEEICLRGHELIHKDFFCADFEK